MTDKVQKKIGILNIANQRNNSIAKNFLEDKVPLKSCYIIQVNK